MLDGKRLARGFQVVLVLPFQCGIGQIQSSQRVENNLKNAQSRGLHARERICPGRANASAVGFRVVFPKLSLVNVPEPATLCNSIKANGVGF